MTLVPVTMQDARPMATIGEKIRALREARGMTQFQLASRAGVRPEAISMAELGKATPRTQTLASVAEALGVALVEILGSEPKQDSSVAQERLDDALEQLWVEAGQTPQRREAVLRSLQAMLERFRREEPSGDRRPDRARVRKRRTRPAR